MNQIQAAANAPEGSVASLPHYSPASFPPTSAILCRNTAPLVSFAFGLIRRGTGCKILGREIGQGLVLLIKKLNATSIPELRLKLEMYEKKETERFERKGEYNSAEQLRDRCNCILLFLARGTSIEDVCNSITKLFDDTSTGLVTLATVHKAKGLEWETVFILDRFTLMPSKWANLPWQKVQEDNLIYVATTRAKLHLRYIESDKWEETAMPLTLSDKDLALAD